MKRGLIGMKVLLCNTYLYRRGGAEVCLFDLAELLSKKGHEVVFFGMDDERNEVAASPDFLVRSIEFSDYGPLRLFWNAKALARVVYSREARAKAKRLVEIEKPDLVHVGNIAHHISPSILDVFRESDIPVVMSLRDYKMICPNSLLLNRRGTCERCKGHRYYNALVNRCKRDSLIPSAVACFEAYAHRHASVYDSVAAFVAPSRFTLEKLREFGIREERLFLVPEFVDPEIYQPVDSNPDPDGYFIYFGRFSKEKGLDVLLEAAALTGRKLLLVGDGQEKPRLERLAARLKANSVRFCERVGAAELVRLIGGALFSVYPSLCYETFGRSIVESFAVARPVVASRIGALAELITDGEDGLLFRPGDADDLAGKISELFCSTARTRAMGERGRIKVLERFTPAVHYSGLCDVWRKIGDGRLSC